MLKISKYNMKANKKILKNLNSLNNRYKKYQKL